MENLINKIELNKGWSSFLLLVMAHCLLLSSQANEGMVVLVFCGIFIGMSNWWYSKLSFLIINVVVLFCFGFGFGFYFS